MDSTMPASVVVCDTEPVAIEGIRALLESCPEFRLSGAETSLVGTMELVRQSNPAVAVIDKAFGMHAVMDWIKRLRGAGCTTVAVIWGVTMTEAEAVRLIQAGALGVIRKTTPLETLLVCLRSVARGSTWTEDALLQEPDRLSRGMRSNLTAREQQVMDLVEQGLKNRDIAMNLGIRPGTVKIHLKHIFEKTGIRGRYGLALSGLREKGLLSLPAN